MNKKQEAFAREYAIDHNGAAAARRAGYSPRRARQTAAALLKRPDVSARIAELEKEARERAEFDIEAYDAEVERVYRRAMAGTPRTYKSSVVRDEDGEVIRVPDLNAAVKALELRAKLFGVLVERHEIDDRMPVIFTLQLDRDLEAEDEPGD